MSTNTLEYSIVDVFADAPFRGNPAGVVITPEILPTDVMQEIAREINLAETAFAVLDCPVLSESVYRLRWYTPLDEENFCGHATLATAHVLFSQTPAGPAKYEFETLAGTLTAEKVGDRVELDLPADDLLEIGSAPGEGVFDPLAETVEEALGGLATLKRAVQGRLDTVLELQLVEGVHLAELRVNEGPLARIRTPRGVILTTLLSTELEGTGPHIHSRMFSPADGMPEDPVTGSAHCTLAAFFVPQIIAASGGQLAVEEFELRATQGSLQRGGEVRAVWDGKSGREEGRVKLRGKAFTVAEGTFFLRA
ncbi:Diaminopimelate epimerase-like protein [Punctularia strigosozonata HHB-11173 SS5]|uniref:Diaminopimelate epimerase-like protein n=1 Tax=Punctularia strigosozonata (strain HHB-11173) TaxID=741275 RepID=UPI000441688E|nr:Diaminopimelate epimerase-like protein [Punctularia strigosozonata HHB-11173 SS5]EIN13465.1 Diaminopimelate epimerase-like protein [Punctularia strigosozonata HHB-11173 SS5]